MHENLAQTVVEAFSAVVAVDPTRPLVTFYDDATGERSELSGATLANWVAKTANLLVDGLGLAPGDVAAVRLPPHWQTAAVLLGCWNAGMSVDVTGSHRAAVAFVTAGEEPRRSTHNVVAEPHGPTRKLVADPGGSTRKLIEVADAGETFALALAPLGLPFRPGPPPGTEDYVVEVRTHGDTFSPQVRPEQPALVDGTTHAGLVEAARGRGLPAASRVLVDGAQTTDPLDWLVGPIVVGTSVVLCRNLDDSRLAQRLESERATRFPDKRSARSWS